MRILVVYHSEHHGNTKKIAEAIAETLSADIMRSEDITPEVLGAYDVIGWGSGIYHWRHHRSLFVCISSLPELLNKRVFIFSTRGCGPVFLCHRAIKKQLIDHECDILAEFSCKGWDTNGVLHVWGGINKKKPDAEDIRDAKIFATGLKKRLSGPAGGS